MNMFVIKSIIIAMSITGMNVIVAVKEKMKGISMNMNITMKGATAVVNWIRNT
jgi:hypothetical protein